MAVVGTGIFSIYAGSSPVSAKDVGFNIGPSGGARVDFQVIKDPAASAQCAVQVLNESYAVVGWTVVDIPPTEGNDTPDGGRTTSHSAIVRTESLGVTGGVNACWILDEA